MSIKPPSEVLQSAVDAVKLAYPDGAGAVSDDLQKFLIDKYISYEQSLSDKYASTKSNWITPLAVALTGLITISGNFVFDYIKSDKNAIVAASNTRREFEYKILESELNKNVEEVKRAKVLLFLVRSGVLDELNGDEIKKMAVEALPKDSFIGIPRLGTAQVRDYLSKQGQEGISKRLSDAALNLLIEFETPSQEKYESANMLVPHVIGAGGVKIGFDYDLKYQSAGKFEQDWSGVLDNGQMDKLMPAIGLVGDQAGSFVSSLNGSIKISYEQAKDAFVGYSIVNYSNIVIEKIRGSGSLNPDCFGAILSLMYNRGSFDEDGDRYLEMRDIKTAIEAGNTPQIPILIRKMKRLWTLPGPLKRREAEAKLCEPQ